MPPRAHFRDKVVLYVVSGGEDPQRGRLYEVIPVKEKYVPFLNKFRDQILAMHPTTVEEYNKMDKKCRDLGLVGEPIVFFERSLLGRLGLSETFIPSPSFHWIEPSPWIMARKSYLN